jgi:glycosyltransferase involved in cell wall biosynthesis
MAAYQLFTSQVLSGYATMTNFAPRGDCNKPMPSVSVIVPSYNHAPYLHARLESIRQQTFQDFELIVLDDASSDDSVAILQDYATRMPMQLVVNSCNSGSPFRQWQKGARLAHGKYLWIAESDDYADPRFLERVVEKLESNPTVGIAYSQSMIVDEEGNERGTWERVLAGVDREHWREDYVLSGDEECGRYLLFANTIPNASGVVLRRDVFLGQVERMPRMRLCGDWLLWARILSVSDVAFVSEALNYHREHQSTVRRTMRLGNHFAEYTIVWKFIARHFRGNAEVQARLRKAIEIGWSFLQRQLTPEDDWKWFRPVGARLRAISPEIYRKVHAEFKEHRRWHDKPFELNLGLRSFVRRLRSFGATFRASGENVAPDAKMTTSEVAAADSPQPADASTAKVLS